MALTISGDPSALAIGMDADTSPQTFQSADARGGVSGGKESFTVAEAANRLVGGEPGWSHALGVGFTVTYGFRADAPATMPEDATGFSRFNTQQITIAEQVLKGWSDAANINFARVGAGASGEAAYSNAATILFANYSGGVEGASAFSYYPGRTDFTSASGDIWVYSGSGYNVNPTIGNYGGSVLVHELGHAIGLSHPSEYDASDTTSPTYSSSADYAEDSRQYTVMSYFNESNTGGHFGGAYSAAPMLDDIAAIQLEYGVNNATRTGDTTYGFNSNAARPWFEATSSASRMVFAVWDAGGKDTFDFSGFSQSQIIDLRAGYFSNVGGLTGNVAVAVGAVIENAIGGGGYDQINGNAAANNIAAGLGDDTVDGGAADDYLRGDSGDDSLIGGTGFDDINGNQGDDTVRGGEGPDWVVGGQAHDRLFGDAGDDVVYGNLGDDTQDGGDGRDWIRGGQGSDSIAGGAGDDWMSGDLGDDTVSGGSGSDIFHTWGAAGLDRVTDFSLTAGDRVQVDVGTVYMVAQLGADTVISMTGGGQMVLQNVQTASLTGGWIFAA
ncbi:M10 family metallopeptidase C-terminal domain-containing protein [Phenylobacterium sp.]|uniref:M10 family metallopeptidase C-terminal domain-containing protein n=1 Tax=Phenylobacterium sp. TaxID=1871053 RepID=UPI00286E747A|nr:M10 family metallopeptidase C-terminal domain-containing protein [Phenylobacterium sp.]